MKKLLSILVGLGVVSLTAVALAVPDPKVEICHKEPQKQDVTIEVAQSAVAAHIANHGDTVGACAVVQDEEPEEEPETPTTPPVTPPTTPPTSNPAETPPSNVTEEIGK